MSTLPSGRLTNQIILPQHNNDNPCRCRSCKDCCKDCWTIIAKVYFVLLPSSRRGFYFTGVAKRAVRNGKSKVLLYHCKQGKEGSWTSSDSLSPL
eukprot:m.40630 g.40630  ORF g.40630 m.40630 type:complete len:95 (+) comp32990_c0_seq3:392-676(+)